MSVMCGRYTESTNIDAALHQAALRELRSFGDAKWAFQIGAAEADAELADGWLRLRAALSRGRIHGVAVPFCAWELAELNGKIAGPAKAAMAPGAISVHLAAEIAIHEEVDLPARIAAACASISRASQLARLGKVGTGASRAPQISTELEALVKTAGWSYVLRPNNEIAVPLDTHRGCTAVVSARGEVRASVALCLDQDLAEPSRKAIGLLLLGVGGAVNMVRGAVRRSDDATSAYLEVALE